MAERKPAQVTAQVQAALDAITAAFREATEVIDAIADRQSAFDQASHLAAWVRRLADHDAPTFRARLVAQIWKDEELSLAALANRIGLSKARAEQLTKLAAKTPQEDK